MHTAFDVKASMFTIFKDGAQIERDDFLDWEVRDRLGVVVDRPYGTLGAGLFILVAISAFYDTPGRKRRMKPLYPDIFLFHANDRRWGPHSSLDFFPDHKEVFVAGGAPEMLRQINNRGITHLVVPDAAPGSVSHRFKEEEAAVDRIKQCFAYGLDGAAADADLEIQTDEMSLLSSFDEVLDPAARLARLGLATSGRVPARLANMPPDELARAIATLSGRVDEISPDDPQRLMALARLGAVRRVGTMRETIRSIPVVIALQMLG